ncbi:MAG TPA: hypothetical protein VGT41_01420 [Candidatus Babeliales bacterium]|nr:hypothetical protein [Candidatus Babeliales bacterium]
MRAILNQSAQEYDAFLERQFEEAQRARNIGYLGEQEEERKAHREAAEEGEEDIKEERFLKAQKVNPPVVKMREERADQVAKPAKKRNIGEYYLIAGPLLREAKSIRNFPFPQLQTITENVRIIERSGFKEQERPILENALQDAQQALQLGKEIVKEEEEAARRYIPTAQGFF